MKKHEIFPTPVWHEEGSISQQLIDELYEGAYVCKESVESAQLSNQGGYQSPSFKWDQFHPEGKKYINNVVGDIFEFNVEGWWYNINSQGDWNSPHTHPNVDLALVLYLTETDDLLTFVNTHPTLNDPMVGYSPHIKKGDILIFPSQLMHFVKQNEREEDRISISMNISIK